MFLYIGACLYPKKTKHRWYNKKRFIIPVSLLAAMVIVAVVLGSTLGSKSTHNASANMCDGFVRRENWDIYGNDTSPVGGVIDYASCCSICQATKDCVAFTYSPSSKECWPKKSVKNGGIFNDKKISGYKVNVCNDFVRKDRWDIPGNDILSSSVQQPDYASCCSTCQAIDECFAFTYSPSSQQCWPKTSMSSGKSSTGDAITGYNPNMCGGFVRKDNWNIPGNDLLASPVRQPDYASCCSICKVNSECAAFTYSPSSHECSLKTSMGGGGNSAHDSTTGYYLNACNDFVRKDRWDISGNDISSSSVQQLDYASCCSTCQAIYECVAFTYSPTSQQCWPKTSMGSGKSSTGDAITGYNLNVCNDFVRKDRWDIPGNDILSSSIQQLDYASCCSTCQAIHGCFAFTYSPSSQQCWPKTSISSGKSSTGDAITGYNPNICGGFIRKDNWDISGNDLLASPVRQPDYASCCLQCQATYGCIAFTYSPSSQRCSLKTSIDSGGHSTSDTITGYSRK
ncbi:unnamed protein product [Rotaria sordida]|uniref:Apple domain-containing protein n=1 Tax=Rotaria sordida TaxID=392033 RepID=A0A814SXE4_9BILA|nr:unnamed protein product [Rotaria sordida]